MLDYSKYYDSNLDQGNPIIVYTGEYDQKCGPLQMDWFKGLLQLYGGGSSNFFD